MNKLGTFELNKVYCMNCVDGLKQLPDKSVDVCLTDFPYGLDFDYGKTYVDTQENLQKLIKDVMPELQRVCKRIVITCGQTNIWLYPKADWIMAWVNNAGANQNKWGFTCWQPILCYGDDAYRKAGMGARPDIILDNGTRDDVKYGNSYDIVKHSCQKPVSFWRRLLERVSVSENDIVLDPFCGSGVTLAVAKQTNRRFIGFEINPEYVMITNKRLEQETLVSVGQQKL